MVAHPEIEPTILGMAEYLQELQRRNKWTDGKDNIELNTLVLLKKDHVPPLQWTLGRVTALFPGQDGVVRVVSVRTQSGEIKRFLKRRLKNYARYP